MARTGVGPRRGASRSCRLRAPRTLNGRERHGRSRFVRCFLSPRGGTAPFPKRPSPDGSLKASQARGSGSTSRNRGWDERMTEDPEGARTPRGERPNPERPLRHRLVLRGAGRRQERRARETTSQTTGRRDTPKVLASPLLSAPVTPVTGLSSARVFRHCRSGGTVENVEAGLRS